MTEKFPTVSLATWRSQVEKELKGAPFEQTLVSQLGGGLDISPLYTDAPGSSAVVGDQGVAVVSRLSGGDVATVAAQARSAMLGGARGLWFSMGGADGVPVDSSESMAAIFAEPADMPQGEEHLPLLVDVGGDLETAVEVLGGLPSTRKIPFVALVDPLGVLAAGGTLGQTTDELKRKLSGRPRFFWAYVASASARPAPSAEAGTGARDELAETLATAVEYLRWGAQGGGLLDFHMRLSVGSDVFLDIAKLRAARILWRKVRVAAGLSVSPIWLHAVTTDWHAGDADPWSNMLRATAGCCGAMLGGADAVTVRVLDTADDVDRAGVVRTARNVGHILSMESFLASVGDPARGSYYIETLTDELARGAWKKFQEIEGRGGMERVLVEGASR